MIDFLLSEGLSILLTISVFLYTFLILWIKTKKNKYFIISASLLTIIVILGATNYYIAFHSNYNSAKFEELYFKKIPKEEMVITLTEIKNSEENKTPENRIKYCVLKKQGIYLSIPLIHFH